MARAISRAASSGAQQERHRDTGCARSSAWRCSPGQIVTTATPRAAQLHAQALEIGDRRGLRRRSRRPTPAARESPRCSRCRRARRAAPSRIARDERRNVWTMPSTLVSKTARNAGRSSGASVSVPRDTPALAMTTSGAPKRAMKSAPARASVVGVAHVARVGRDRAPARDSRPARASSASRRANRPSVAPCAA